MTAPAMTSNSKRGGRLTPRRRVHLTILPSRPRTRVAVVANHRFVRSNHSRPRSASRCSRWNRADKNAAT